MALLLGPPSAAAATLTGVSLSAPTQLAGATETWTVQFTTVGSVAAGGDIRIVFPAGFQTSNGGLTACAVAGKSGVVTVVVSATEVVCELGVTNTLGAAEAVSLTLTNLRNPTTAQTTGAFTLQTRTVLDAVVDTHTTNTEVITVNALTAVAASAPLQATGAVETWTIAFTTTNPVAASGDIRIVLPAGFVTSSGSATVCDVTTPLTVVGETTTVVSPSEVVCNLGALDSIAAGTATSLTLTNVKNPTTVQTTGAFTLQTRNNADALHDQHTANTESIVAATLASLTASAPAQRTGAVETWTIAFTTVNAVAANGDIRIVFPAGFVTSSGAATLCDVAGKAGETTNVVSATEVLCNLNSATLAASEAVSLTLTNVKDPPTVQTTGAFTVQTRDAADALHDSHGANTESIASSTLTGVAISAPLQSTGAVETWTFAFTTINAVAANGDVRVVFPTGFTTSSGAATVCDLSGKTGETTSVASATEVVCNLNSATLAASEAATLNLTNVKNPASVQTTPAFQVITRDASDAVHDDHTTDTESIVASTLSGVSISAPLQTAGATETWTFAFTTQNAVAAGGDIRIVLPGGFQTSNGGLTACAVAGKTGVVTVVVSATEVVCELGVTNTLGAAEAVSLTLTNVRNPVSPQTTGAFTLQTRTVLDAIVDTHASDTELILAGLLAGVSAGAPLQTTGSVETWTVSLTTMTAVPANGDIHIVFPAGFATSSGGTTACDLASKSGETTAVPSPTEVICNLNTVTLTAAEAVSLTLTLIKDPTAAQTTGAFTVQTRDASDVVLDEHTTNTEQITASTLSSVSVSAPLQRVGATETWTFSFVTVNPVAAAGDIRILLPAGFAASSGSATVCDVVGKSGESTAVAGSQEVRCELGSNTLGAGESVTLSLTNVLNPASAGATGAFILQTRSAADAVHDQHSTDTETLSLGSLSSVAFGAPLQAAGAVETWTVAFVSNGVAANGDIRIVFPSGFTLSSGAASACDLAGKTGETATVVAPTEIVCNLNGATLASGESVSLAISNVRDPLTARTTAAFGLYLRDASDSILDQHLINTEVIVAHAFAVAPVQASADRNASAPSSHTFTFTLFNAWEAGGRLKVEFPPGFAFNEGAATTVTAATFSGSGGGSLQTPTFSGTTITLVRTGGSDLPTLTQVTLGLSNVKNPATGGLTGTFRLATLDGSGAEHDAATIAGITVLGGLAPTTPGLPTDPSTESPSPAPSDGPAAAAPAKPGPIPVRIPGFEAAVLVASALAALVLARRRA